MYAETRFCSKQLLDTKGLSVFVSNKCVSLKSTEVSHNQAPQMRDGQLGHHRKREIQSG